MLEKQYSLYRLLLLYCALKFLFCDDHNSHCLLLFHAAPHVSVVCRLPATILRALSHRNYATCYSSQRTESTTTGIWKRTAKVHWTVPRVVARLAACRVESTVYQCRRGPQQVKTITLAGNSDNFLQYKRQQNVGCNKSNEVKLQTWTLTINCSLNREPS